MGHVDVWRGGKKLVSATQLQTVVAKPFLDMWRLKLCHCLTHATAKKTPLKPAEKEALAKFGPGHCGFVYADTVKDSAGDLGTRVHEIIEIWFNGLPLIPEKTEAMMWADKILTIFTEHKVKPQIIKPEENLIDEESNLAGSPDLVAEWDGELEIIDYKIKNSLDPLMAFQGCAYRYLIKRRKGIDIRWMRAIWCQKESKSKDVKSDVRIDLNEWMTDWKSLVTIWNRVNPNRKVTLFD